jgi:hypothetical protein
MQEGPAADRPCRSGRREPSRGSGSLVVRWLAPPGREPMAGFVGGLGAERLPAAGAQTVVPAVPAPELLITA